MTAPAIFIVIGYASLINAAGWIGVAAAAVHIAIMLSGLAALPGRSPRNPKP